MPLPAGVCKCWGESLLRGVEAGHESVSRWRRMFFTRSFIALTLLQKSASIRFFSNSTNWHPQRIVGFAVGIDFLARPAFLASR